jgi:hypothetical protein
MQYAEAQEEFDNKRVPYYNNPLSKTESKEVLDLDELNNKYGGNNSTLK